MNLSRLIRHPRTTLRLVDTTQPRPAVAKTWGPLAAPVDPLETQTRIRAQSILSGPLLGACPPLTLAQAHDVMAWYRPRTP